MWRVEVPAKSQVLAVDIVANRQTDKHQRNSFYFEISHLYRVTQVGQAFYTRISAGMNWADSSSTRWALGYFATLQLMQLQ